MKTHTATENFAPSLFSALVAEERYGIGENGWYFEPGDITYIDVGAQKRGIQCSCQRFMPAEASFLITYETGGRPPAIDDGGTGSIGPACVADDGIVSVPVFNVRRLTLCFWQDNQYTVRNVMDTTVTGAGCAMLSLGDLSPTTFGVAKKVIRR